MKNAASKRMSKEEFLRVAGETPLWQKMDTLRKLDPSASARCEQYTETQIDGILYGLHLMMTSPAFA